MREFDSIGFEFDNPSDAALPSQFPRQMEPFFDSSTSNKRKKGRMPDILEKHR